LKRNYSSCTGRSSENLCSSSGGSQEKRKTGWNWGTIKIDGFLSFTPALNANVLFGRFYSNLTLCIAKLRALVLCFPNFTDISIISKIPLVKFGVFSVRCCWNSKGCKFLFWNISTLKYCIQIFNVRNWLTRHTWVKTNTRLGL
jgi:hypothetical protein